MGFKVQTTDGTFVTAGKDGKGLDEAVAAADAKGRNDRALVLGIKARYEVVPVTA